MSVDRGWARAHRRSGPDGLVLRGSAAGDLAARGIPGTRSIRITVRLNSGRDECGVRIVTEPRLRRAMRARGPEEGFTAENAEWSKRVFWDGFLFGERGGEEL